MSTQDWARQGSLGASDCKCPARARPPLARVGFFHFVVGHAEPVPALWQALEQAGSPSADWDSLLVLPEAFNIGKPYKENGACNRDRGVLCELMEISQIFRVVILAGLIIDIEVIPNPPHSSAYLIDSTGAMLISRKRVSDGNEHNTPYTSCSECDPCNPYAWGTDFLIALICVDSGDDLRRQDLLRKAGAATRCIVCIPACMGRPNMCEAIAQNWRPWHVVLANSDPNGIGSFVACSGSVITHVNAPDSNAIRWIDLSDSLPDTNPSEPSSGSRNPPASG